MEPVVTHFIIDIQDDGKTGREPEGQVSQNEQKMPGLLPNIANQDFELMPIHGLSTLVSVFVGNLLYVVNCHLPIVKRQKAEVKSRP